MEAERGKRQAESLGWLTESAVMPNKHRAIEGVGAGSIVELKAHLYRTQEEARKTKEFHGDRSADFLRAKKKPLPSDVFSQKNTGVESRSKRDKLELKAVNDGFVSYAALEKKAALYDKLARGEISDEEEREKYCVDFFQKSIDQEEAEQPEAHDAPTGVPQKNEDGVTDDLLINEKLVGPGRASAMVDHDEHKRLVREVHEEVNQARQKATTVKLRRQEQEVARREKLRQAYLRKQLEKLTSSKQTSRDS